MHEPSAQNRRFTPSPSMAVALAALFVALGGTGYAAVVAANSVNSRSIVDRSVQKVDIANGAVTNAKLANSAVNSTKVAVFVPGQAEPVEWTEDTTADWGAKPFPQPQSSLVGSMFRCAHADGDLVISDPGAWPFAGLGMAAGTRLLNVIGPEFDRVNISVATPRPRAVGRTAYPMWPPTCRR